jgi:uncharacterized membrane protein HdeD (DUF308 family)
MLIGPEETTIIALIITIVISVFGYLDRTKVLTIFAGMLWILLGLVFLAPYSAMLLLLCTFTGLFFMVGGVIEIAT